MSFSRFKLFFVIIILWSFYGCSYIRRDIRQASPVLRVLIDKGVFFRIRSKGNYVFQIGYQTTPGNGPFIISVNSNRIELNGIPLDSEEVVFVPSHNFSVGGQSYRGSLRVVLKSNELFLINEINIENYLLSVLPSEVPVSWQPEALKAQAIVARTYALFEMESARGKNQIFDVYSTTRSQVYKGSLVENKYTSAAVRSTLGEVVTWKGKIAKTYFHASTGGMTESSGEAFNDPRPYLKAVISPYGRNYSLYHWSTNIPARVIETKFQDILQGHLKGIAVSSRTVSKRIKTVVLIDDKGLKHSISGGEFRMKIGPTVMRSSRANIQVKNGKILISGVGYGHGVGMGQWDAQDMALRNKTHKQIIEFFYPGTRLKKLW